MHCGCKIQHRRRETFNLKVSDNIRNCKIAVGKFKMEIEGMEASDSIFPTSLSLVLPCAITNSVLKADTVLTLLSNSY